MDGSIFKERNDEGLLWDADRSRHGGRPDRDGASPGRRNRLCGHVHRGLAVLPGRSHRSSQAGCRREPQGSFYDERPSNGIAVAPAPASVGKGSIYAVTHVDVIPPSKDDCIVMLKKLADDTRKEPNAESFEAWQQNNRANHFTVTEIWKNRAAHDAHVAATTTKEFREKLGPMSGALYDERLYRSL